jgi:hypothetical protein
MRTLTLLTLIVILTAACNKKSSVQSSGFTANVRIVTPIAGTVNGKLYLSKRRLPVDLGPMLEVFDANQEKGWRTIQDSKQYMKIGWKDVSTYASDDKWVTMFAHGTAVRLQDGRQGDA